MSTETRCVPRPSSTCRGRFSELCGGWRPRTTRGTGERLKGRFSRSATPSASGSRWPCRGSHGMWPRLPLVPTHRSSTWVLLNCLPCNRPRPCSIILVRGAESDAARGDQDGGLIAHGEFVEPGRHATVLFEH